MNTLDALAISLDAVLDELKAITGAVYDYASDLSTAVQGALNGRLTARSLERSHRAYLEEYARLAYLEGMEEGGVEDAESEIESEEEDGIDRWLKEQLGFVKEFSNAVIDARGDDAKEADISARVDLWVKAMEGLRGLGVIIAKANVTGTFHLGSTDEHCDTCKGLNGTNKRMSKWRDSGLLPQTPGNRNFQCGCWECKCYITDSKGRQLYP
jgi:hypothetical protein